MTKNICRACLTEEGTFQSVFLKESSSGLSTHISEMLCACAKIQVNEEDGLPDQICSDCCEQTVKMFLFKLKCEKSDVILRERLKKGKVETVETKNKCDDIAIKESLVFIENFKMDEFRRHSDEKNVEKISYQALKEKSKIKEFETNICQESVKQDDFLTSRKLGHAMEIKVVKIDDEGKESLFSCPECDFVFVERENLDNHISELHIKKESEESCDEDLKQFEEQFVNMNSPLETKPLVCDICFKGFSQISELENHMKIHTSTSTQTVEQTATISFVVYDKEFQKLHECDVCKRKFKNSANLLRHKRIHTGEKPYECDICKRKFAQIETLASHKRTHTGEKPFKCEICNKKFAQTSGLRYHKKLHTGERPYECDMCEMKFIRLCNLKNHKLIHEAARPHECDVCKKSFTQSQH